MPLFETSTAPCGDRPKKYSESIYAYYRDSERIPMIAIRALLEAWFIEIPASEQLDLQQRFRSPIQRQHRSALFELYLHHLLLRCGFQVEFHPVIHGVSTHPDFLVMRDGEPRFYLEAIAVGNSAKEESEINRINQVYDTLNQLKSPDFFLSIRVYGAPTTSPAGAKLRTDLERWLRTLDWKTLSASYEAERYGGIPAYEWEHDGWYVTFEPIPKTGVSRGTDSINAIGMTSQHRARQLELDQDLKDAVVKKDRYGNLPLPFVVAVQVVDEHRIERYDVMNGLIGQETVRIGPNREAIPERLRNGAWVSRNGPARQTISAVAVWSTLEPWNFATLEPMMVHNPYPLNPLPNDLFPIRQEVIDREKSAFVEQMGKPISEVLGLAAEWLVED